MDKTATKKPAKVAAKKPAKKSAPKKAPKKNLNRSTPIMVGIRLAVGTAKKLRKAAEADSRSLTAYVGLVLEAYADGKLYQDLSK